MVLRSIVLGAGFVTAVLIGATSAMAQAAPCTAGPGAAFGVTSYSCASCAMEFDKDRRPLSLFRVEPIVLTVQAGSLLQPGDVVLSVGGHSITTRQGAAMFASAPPNAVAIEVRRQGRSTRVTAQGTFPCEAEGALAIGDKDLANKRLTILAQMFAEKAAVPGRFGFALACLPSCTKTRASDGTEYWKFDAEPPVQELRLGGIAEIAGLKIGDRVVEVNGASILTEAGAIPLWRGKRVESLTLVVIRNNGRVTLVLRGR